MICPTCNSDVLSLKAIVHKGAITRGCDNCVRSRVTHGNNDSAKYDRDRDREDHRGDIVQPFEGRDYIRARGIGGAREAGYSDEDIRIHG